MWQEKALHSSKWNALTNSPLHNAQRTRGGNKLQIAAQIIKISSNTGIKTTGSVELRSLNHFSRFIALSTWIRALATAFVFRTSSFVICTLPDPGGGITKVACLNNRSSWIGKPRSARITSPGSIRSRIPDCWTINLSVALPPQAGDMNDIRPSGAIATRYLRVLWCL